MGRDELLKQKREREEAQKELDQKYKNPASIKYDLFDEAGNKTGFVEYTPQNDIIFISPESAGINGKYIRSLRDILNKLLDG